MESRTAPPTAGFTLLELLLFVATSGTLLLVASLFISVLLQTQVKHQATLEIEESGAQALLAIGRTIREADSITSPVQGTSASSTTLAFAASGRNPTILDLSGGSLRIAENNGQPTPLTGQQVVASNLTFENLSRTNTPGILRIQFTLSLPNPSGKQEYDYSKTFTSSFSLR